MDKNRIKVISRIKDFSNREACELFFAWLNNLTESLNLNENNEQLAINVRNDNRKRISVNLNSRLVLGLTNRNTELELMLMVYIKDLPQIKNYREPSEDDYFARGEEKALVVSIPVKDIDPQAGLLMQLWLKCCNDYKPLEAKSRYSKHHIPLLYSLIKSKELREEIYHEAEITKSQIDNRPEYFLKSEFDVLNKYKKNEKEKGNDEHQNAYDLLSGTYRKVEYWANEVQKKLFKNGSVDILRKPTTQANRFAEYLWAKIYPDKTTQDQRHLAYTVSVSDGDKFHVKIDTIDLKDQRQRLYENYRGDFNNSPIVKIIPSEEWLQLDWDDLIDETIEIIKSLETDFDKLKTIIFNTKNNTAMESSKAKHYFPLNQILFGPPGTGKTYNTINKALEIARADIGGKTRKELKELFDAKMKEGQIVFTTFHQSMSYEDFIEGIKPVEPKIEGQSISYKIVDGIFKRACSFAAYNCYKLYIKSNKKSEKYLFDDLYDAFIESIHKQINDKNPPVYLTLRGREVEVKEINRNESIIARAKNSIASNSAPLTKENMQKLYDKFKTIDEIKDLQQVQEAVQVTPRITEFYAVFSGLKQFEKTFTPDEQLLSETNELEVVNIEEIQKKFNAGVYNEAVKMFSKVADPIIIIIDEINRGNVSQIFGELITLIEEDKRLGREEALEAILPYSKENFGVPQNLYIIGTMNTADRSVEALDTALRRRFNFEEMRPNSYLIETKGMLKEVKGVLNNISLPLVLDIINKRIEKLLDRDHQIGHSYLMEVNSMEELKLAFNNKIIPLLQEYFFGDYGKIGLVLGKGFFEDVNTSKTNIFSDFYEYDSSEYSERTVYQLKNVINMSDEEFKEAINQLMK